jgi:DNA mismatch repair protein MutS2
VTLEGGGKESVPSEINLIGRSIEEGLGALEKFLDDVILAGHREVRIVHGHGTGRLRKAVAGFLDGHPLVSGHHPADARSGGSGATVAVLKD